MQVLRLALNVTTPLVPQSYKDYALKISILRLCGLTVGTDVSVGRSFDFLIGYPGGIDISHHVNIANHVGIYSFKQVSIGEFTAIGPRCFITDGGHDVSNHKPCAKGLTIGRGVFMGAAAVLAGSISVGDNALVAAGSVVLSNVPPGVIVAGNPAKEVGRRPLADAVWHYPDTWYNPNTYEISSSI